MGHITEQPSTSGTRRALEMHKIAKHRRVYVGLMGLAALVTIGIVAAVAGQTSSSAVGEPGVLKTIPASVLEGGKLYLSVPSAQGAASAKLARATAEDTARKRTAGKVVESALAIVNDRLGEPSMKCLCWVVASEPPGGVYIHQPIPRDGQPTVRFVPTQTYHLDIIDAVTGQWLYAAEGAHGSDQIVK